MTIVAVRPLPIGNAIQLFLAPPAGAKHWRVLRKDADTFTGPDDVDATLVFDEADNNVVVDDQDVVNGVAYWYRIYYSDGSAWIGDFDAVSAAAASTYRDESVDAMAILRDRLEAALKVEVARGNFKPQNGAGIPVLLAPPVWQNNVWPLVTIHLDADSSDDRSLGETVFPDVNDGVFIEGEGWLARVSLAVIGWSTNADERAELRRAIKRIVIGNLPVFESHGMVTVDFSQQDVEDFTSYEAPVYETVGRFSCRAPSLVTDDVDPIIEVTVEAEAYF